MEPLKTHSISHPAAARLCRLLLLFVCGTSLASPRAALSQEKPAPPNIVFIFSDDLAYQAISAYQDPRKLLETPGMDRIAREGVRFDRALVPNSICGPSRATVLTGKYSHANGFANNVNSVFDGSQTTFPKLLQQAGYQTAVIGKWHLVSDPTGFDHWDILPGQGLYYQPQFLTNGVKNTVPGYVTDIITDKSLDWLKKRDPSKPFLLMTQHKAPHREWAPALRHLNHDSDRVYPEPETLFEDLSTRGFAVRNQDMTLEKTFTPTDAKFVAPANLSPDQKKEWDAYYEPRNAAFREKNLTGTDLVRWRYNRYMHDYLGTVKAVDESVARILKYLDDNGLAENTIVVISSDQGFYLGEHGWFDKRWIFEQSVRTPLLIRWPGVAKAGVVNHDLVSTVDFAQTFLDAAGIPVPADMQGRSLTPVIKGQTPADWRKSFYYHYYEYPVSHHVRPHYGVVTERFKLTRFYAPDVDEWELYDLKNDPNEVLNVYGKPEYAKEQAELHTELDRLRAELKVPDPDPPGFQGGPRPRPPRTPENKEVFHFDSARTPSLPAKSGSAALDPSGIPWTVEAEITPGGGPGVIVAHGGQSLGYALYLEPDGTPAFSARLSDTELVTAHGKKPLSGQSLSLRGVIGKDKTLSLFVNQELAAQATLPGFIPARPSDGMELGKDTGSPVLSGPAAVPFQGVIHSVRLFSGEKPDPAAAGGEKN